MVLLVTVLPLNGTNMALPSKLTTEQRCDSQDDEDEDQDEDFPYYYEHDYDQDIPDANDAKKDPEYFEFDCLKVEDVERLLNESVEAICSKVAVTPSLAKVSTVRGDWLVLIPVALLHSSGLTAYTQLGHCKDYRKVEDGLWQTSNRLEDQTSKTFNS